MLLVIVDARWVDDFRIFYVHFFIFIVFKQKNHYLQPVYSPNFYTENLIIILFQYFKSIFNIKWNNVKIYYIIIKLTLKSVFGSMDIVVYGKMDWTDPSCMRAQIANRAN